MGMRLKNLKVAPAAIGLWYRRAEALKAGTDLVAEKPDRDLWSNHDYRIWSYAMAISRRVEQLH